MRKFLIDFTKISTFRELDCWKKARELVRLMYHFTAKGAFAKDFGLRDQVQRSSVSIMANIAEGFGTFSDAEFIRYLSISIRSAFEVQSHLYVAHDVKYLDEGELMQAMLLTDDCINLSKGLIRYLKEKT